MKTSDKMNDNRAVVIAAMVCVTILVYGLMQMWIANGQRYEYYHYEVNGGYGSNANAVRIFDKRTGEYYTFNGTVFDLVNARIAKRKYENTDDK